MRISDAIMVQLQQVLSEELGVAVDLPRESDLLSELGADSLVFAILVARLEDELGFDPFVDLEEPSYPSRVGEFIEVYEAGYHKREA